MEFRGRLLHDAQDAPNLRQNPTANRVVGPKKSTSPGRKSTQEFEARLAMLPMGLGGLRRAVGYRRSLQRSGPRLETPKPKPENPDPQP